MSLTKKTMKTLLLTLLFSFFLFTFNSFSQEWLDYGLYYVVNPNHQIKKYEKILVFTNADLETREKMKKVAKKTGFNIVIANDYFKTDKKWSDFWYTTVDSEKVDSITRIINPDAIIHINRKGVEKTYDPGLAVIKGLAGMGFLYSGNRTDVQIEAYFIDVKDKEDYAFHCQGSVGGKVSPAMFKSLYRMFQKFPKIGVAYPSK